MRLYAGDPEDMDRRIDDAPSAYDAARALMTVAATAYTRKTTPKGCLLANGEEATSFDLMQTFLLRETNVKDICVQLARAVLACVESGVLIHGAEAA